MNGPRKHFDRAALGLIGLSVLVSTLFWYLLARAILRSLGA